MRIKNEQIYLCSSENQLDLKQTSTLLLPIDYKRNLAQGWQIQYFSITYI